MTTAAVTASKVPYPSANVDWEAFHRQFDEALAGVRGQLGRDHSLYIAGEAVSSPAAPIVDTSPIDTGVVLGRFAAATAQQVDRAVTAAKEAQRAWAHTPWRARLAALRAPAGQIREPKIPPAAAMSLHVGQSRPEATGAAREAA